MLTLKGKSVSSGITIGPLALQYDFYSRPAY